MTNEQAYKVLTEHTRYYIPIYDADALEAAIFALEKRVPKRYKKLEGRFACPVCDGFIDWAWQKYCCRCGQALDWSWDDDQKRTTD